MLKQKWQHKRSNLRYYTQLMSTIIVSGMLLCIASHTIEERSKEKQLCIIEQAIKRAAIEYYSIEGAYPKDLEALKSHSFIKVDQEKYLVHYEIFASNIMPDITVLNKK